MTAAHRAALDGRGLDVVREEAALRVAVGGGHRHMPRRGEEARQGQADREVVRPDHHGVRGAAGPDARPQGPRQEGLVDQKGVHPVLRRVERGGHVLHAACRGPLEDAGPPARTEVLHGRVGVGIHSDVGVAGNDHQVPPTEAARCGIYLYVGPERRPSRRGGAECLRSVDVDEAEANLVRWDLKGRGLPGDEFRETEHVVLGHVLAADGGDEASPSRGGGRPRFRRSAAEEGGVPFVPKRRGHVHLLCPGGDPCLLEHDGKAPLLGQHAGDEVLLISTGHGRPASSECVPEGPVSWDQAVAQVPGEEPEGVARCVFLESAVPHQHRRGVHWGSQGCAGAMGCGEPAPRGVHKGASPAGMDSWWAATPAPGAASAASSSSPRAATWPAAWGGAALGARGVPRGSSVPVPG